jgi:hypothetical protein
MSTLNELCAEMEAKALARGHEIVRVDSRLMNLLTSPEANSIVSKPGRLVVVEIPSIDQ